MRIFVENLFKCFHYLESVNTFIQKFLVILTQFWFRRCIQHRRIKRESGEKLFALIRSCSRSCKSLVYFLKSTPLLRSALGRQDGKAQKAGQARRTARTFISFLLSVKKQGMIQLFYLESFFT